MSEGAKIIDLMVALQKSLARTPVSVSGQLKEIRAQLANGCGNNGCTIKQPVGMATNGGCRCSPLQIGNELERLGRELRKQVTWPKEGS